MVDAVRVRAHTKLTLSLRVLGRRPDGYHDLEALVASLDAPADELAVAVREAGGVGVGVIGPASEGVPSDQSNLAVQAAAGVLRHGVDVPGLAVAIHKAIPAEAGLGGGSADAAAVLVALQHLLDDAPSDEAMLEIAAAIGSDVPACFMGGLMRMTGRGEDVKQLTPVDGWVAVVAVPSTRLSTATVYRAWSDLPAGTRPREIEAPAALRDLADVLVNDLEPAALLVDPELARFRDAVRDAAGVEPLLAGSGSAYVVVVDASIGSEVMAASISAALAADGFAPRLVAAGAPAQRGVDLLGEG